MRENCWHSTPCTWSHLQTWVCKWLLLIQINWLALALFFWLSKLLWKNLKRAERHCFGVQIISWEVRPQIPFHFPQPSAFIASYWIWTSLLEWYVFLGKTFLCVNVISCQFEKENRLWNTYSKREEEQHVIRWIWHHGNSYRDSRSDRDGKVEA